MALEGILAHRSRFTTVTILTKNPTLCVKDGYIDLFRTLTTLPVGHPKQELFAAQGLPALQIEVSLAFWNEAAAAYFDPGAPTVVERKKAILQLTAAGIPVVLRIDPLFPRLPPACGKTLAAFGLPEAQSVQDLRDLVSFGWDAGVRHVVYSPAKIVSTSRREMSDAMVRMKEVYRLLSRPGQPVWRGGSWRLPRDITDKDVVAPFLAICAEFGVAAKFCMTNLIETL